VHTALAFLDVPPVLRSLSLASWGELDASVHVAPLNKMIHSLGPRLKSCAFTTLGALELGSSDLDWTPLTSLQSFLLELPLDGQLLSVLRRLPVELSDLRLLEGEDDQWTDLLEALSERPLAIASLEILTLPSCGVFEGEDEAAEAESLCAERGTALRRRETGTDCALWEDHFLIAW
jgi:hypothetical protein